MDNLAMSAVALNSRVKNSYYAFLQLYVALALIVLALIMAAFYRPGYLGSKVNPHHPEFRTANSVDLNRLFIPDKPDIDALQLQVLLDLLKTHDVNVVIEISPSSNNPSDVDLAFARAIVLSRRLLKQIPTFSFKVIVSPARPRPDDVKLIFARQSTVLNDL